MFCFKISCKERLSYFVLAYVMGRGRLGFIFNDQNSCPAARGGALIPCPPCPPPAIRESYRELFLLALSMPPATVLQPNLSRPPLGPGSALHALLFSFSIHVWWDGFPAAGCSLGSGWQQGPPCLPPQFLWAENPGTGEPLCAAGSPLLQGGGFLLPAGIAMLSAPRWGAVWFPCSIFEHQVEHFMHIKMCILYILLQWYNVQWEQAGVSPFYTAYQPP